MADLTNDEVFSIAAASEAIRDSARTMEFTKYTMDDVRKQAIDAIGGETPESSAAPLGELEVLDILEERISNLVERAKERNNSGNGS